MPSGYSCMLRPPFDFFHSLLFVILAHSLVTSPVREIRVNNHTHLCGFKSRSYCVANGLFRSPLKVNIGRVGLVAIQ